MISSYPEVKKLLSKVAMQGIYKTQLSAFRCLKYKMYIDKWAFIIEHSNC